MKRDLHIVPECYVDTNLVETMLALAGYQLAVNHQKGCNTVAKTMQSGKLRDGFALGMIDNDKQKHSYVNDFREITRTEHLSVRKHPEVQHYLIVVMPKAVDQFILDVARREGVRMEEYGFSSHLKLFTEETKRVASKDDINFKKLFRAIQNDGEIRKLMALLRYFHERNNTANTSDVEKIMTE